MGGVLQRLQSLEGVGWRKVRGGGSGKAVADLKDVFQYVLGFI